MKRHPILFLLIVFLFSACTTSTQTATVSTPQPTQDSEPSPVVQEELEDEGESADNTAPTATLPPTATPVPQENTTLPGDYPAEGYGPEDFPETINPLTGLPVEVPENLDRRPIGLKIANFPRDIRPQWGLTKADLVYEYYHDGGITRFFAIFYGQNAAQVAPIRSARFSDENFIRMYKASLTFGGTYEDVRDFFYKSNFGNRLLYNVTSDSCPASNNNPVCRFDPAGMNHLMTDTQKLEAYFTERGLDNERQDLSGMWFQADPPPSEAPGTELRIRYTDSNYHLWSYNPDIEEYIRYQEKEESTGESYEILSDRVNNIPISADNVVVLVVHHKPLESTHEAYRFTLVGSGEAYAFRDGNRYELQWSRPEKSDVLYLTDAEGERFPFRPGTTWFEVMGINSEITEAENGLNIKANVP
jgi:hypothetical protein